MNLSRENGQTNAAPMTEESGASVKVQSADQADLLDQVQEAVDGGEGQDVRDAAFGSLLVEQSLGKVEGTASELTSPKSIEMDMSSAEKEVGIQRGDVVELPLDQSPDFIPGLLSIDYLQTLDDQALFDELVSHPGVGVKTAACIMAFNLARPVFAVDIHVFRLCKFLGWSPKGLDENKTCELLDVIVPNEIKYGLHQAFWHHGQFCGRCKSGATEKSAGWADGCPIEEFVDRSRYVPLETKAQKERKAEAAALALKKAAEEKAAAEAQEAGEEQVDEQVDEVKTPKRRSPRKRKAVVTPDETSSGEAEEAGESQPPKPKRVRAKKEVEDDTEAEWAEIPLHDDFDAGRSQNITKTMRFKVTPIKFSEASTENPA